MEGPYKLKYGESSTQTETYAVVREDGVYYESCVYYDITDALSLREDLNFAWRSGRESQAARIAELEDERDQMLDLVRKAEKWFDGMRHGRDFTGEGFSIPREEDEGNLADAVMDYRKARKYAAEAVRKGSE